MTLPSVELHLNADRYCKPGEAHLICAAQDFQVMAEFFKKHFELWSPVMEEGGWPTGYRMKISEPKEQE